MGYRYKKFVKVQPLFFILATVMIALGYKEQFFVLILVISLHEFSHIFIAYLFGMKVEKLFLTPLGQRVVLKDFEYNYYIKKIFVILAGPLLNIFLYFICKKIFCNRYIIFQQVNLGIFLFNMLPIYPLDGGRLIQIYLGNKIGVINGNRVMIKISKLICIIMFFMGIIQVILYPFNLSLFCLSIYLLKINQREYVDMTFDFYRFLIANSKKIESKKFLYIDFILLNKEFHIKNLLNRITWDKYYIVYFFDENKNLYNLTETEIVNYYLNNNYDAVLFDIVYSK